MKGHVNTSGYPRVALTKNGKLKYLLVHRLVAIAFIENKENKEFVEHIDNDKLNNNVTNLRWSTEDELALLLF